MMTDCVGAARLRQSWTPSRTRVHRTLRKSASDAKWTLRKSASAAKWTYAPAIAEPRGEDPYLRVASVDPGGLVSTLNAREAERLAHDVGVRRFIRAGDYIMSVNGQNGGRELLVRLITEGRGALELKIGRRRGLPLCRPCQMLAVFGHACVIS